MIYSEKQRGIMAIQVKRLEAEVRLLKKFKPLNWSKQTQIDALESLIDELKEDLTKYNRRHSD